MGRYCGRSAVQWPESPDWRRKHQDERHPTTPRLEQEISYTSRECVRKAGGTNRSAGTVRGPIESCTPCAPTVSRLSFIQLTNPTSTPDVQFLSS